MKTVVLFLLTLLSFGIASGSPSSGEWQKERARRNKAIESYYKANAENAKAFLVEPNGIGPVPMVMFRLFQDLFPEIWGTAKEQYAPAGLKKNPFAPHSVLPLGTGYSVSEETLASFPQGPVKFNKVGFTCVACHSGQVQVSKNKTITMFGAPNTRTIYPLYLMAETAKSPAFTAEKFHEALAKKPAGWIYQDSKMIEIETKEREIFNTPGVAEEMVANFKAYIERVMGGFAYINRFAYKAENAPDPLALKRGSLDVLTTTFLTFVTWAKVNQPDIFKPENLEKLVAALPAQAAEIDSPSIWNQKGRGRGHWDATTGNPLHRNIGAAASVLNKPVDVANVQKITSFTENLPSNPYPFDVDMTSARRGERLFQKNCVSCHSAQNKVFDAAAIGTDINRLNHFTPTAAGFLGGLLLSLCTDPSLCKKSDGTDFPPSELSIKTNGYVAGRLDGIWARAPYLHNGSVPTLYALLTNKRPEKFYRGALSYDQEKVGFTWDQNLDGTVEYNTRLDGNSNRGHSSMDYLGLDWDSHPTELADLLEYMKTL
jgi:hypothetical protein